MKAKVSLDYSDVKQNNIRNVFYEICHNGPLLRREVQDRTGLSWGAVSNICNTLLDKKLIIEKAIGQVGAGRKPHTLQINSSDNFIIGIDLHISGIRSVVCDLNGAVKKTNVTFLDDNRYENVIESVLNNINELLSDDMGKKNILAISVAIQGIVDSKNGISVSTPFSEWNNVPLRDIIHDKFHIPVFLFHDPDCILMAEKVFGTVWNDEYENILVVRIDDGIGMAMQLKSQMYVGGFGQSGEFGHMTIVPAGRLCSCGSRGCLEAYASGNGIVSRYKEMIKSGAIDAVMTDEHVNYQSIANYAKRGNSECQKLFKDLGKYLGIGLSNLIQILAPDQIILNGALVRELTLFSDDMYSALEKYGCGFYKSHISISSLGGIAPAIGATMYALDYVIDDFLEPSEKSEK